MNKFIPLFLGLMIPLSSALADSFTNEAVEFCRSKGGNYSLGSQVEEGDKYCRQITCKKTNNVDGKYEIPAGATGPEANVEATKRVCLSKSQVDGVWTGDNTIGPGNSSGVASGAASGVASGAASGVASGAASGVASGAASGATSGATSGAGAGGDAIVCEELEGEGRIEPGGLCYHECKPKRDWKTLFIQKKSGFERKSCVECLLKYPGVYRVKREYLPKDKDGNVIGDRSVGLGRGVTVKTGVIVCKDANGRVVSVTGTACPTGTVLHTTSGAASGVGAGGTIIIGGGVTSGVAGGVAGGISIGGGVAAGAGAGANRPSYCLNPKNKKDIEMCDEWIRLNARFECSSGGNVAACTGGASNEISARYNMTDCVNCGAGGRRQSTLSGVAEVIGALAPIGVAGISGYFGYKSQKAWAGAAEAGFEQCRLSQSDYMQYLQANELPALTPAQQAAMNCNGYNLGAYGGLGSSGLNGWYGAGYTPGFVGGMMGPYGGYNPFGNCGFSGCGGAVGGMMVGGYAGGFAGGGMMVGGYAGGFAGGFAGGVQVAGGFNGGYASGYNGGYAGGFPGGFAGGVQVAGGFNGGYASGYNGGYAGGFPGGFAGGVQVAGGFNGGYASGYNGGYAGGFPGGFAGGVQVAGGFNGGYNGGFQGGYAGGFAGGVQVAGGFNGGYAGGYLAGGGVGGGYYNAGAAGGYAGGYAGGMNGGYMDYANSQSAANYDRMLQQQGTSFQMGALGGSAAYNPMNAGFTLGASLGFGGYNN